jgi:hypothetical protein
MGVFQKKSVPVRVNGRNIPNVTAKIEKRGMEPWEIVMDEQEDELIIEAILRNQPIHQPYEIQRRIGNNDNFVEYRFVNLNNNNNNNNNQYNNNQNQYNEEYGRWAAEHLLNMMARRGGRKYKRTTKKSNKHKRLTRKQK